jgi:hypothetical protein
MSGLWLFLAALLAVSAGHKLVARDRLSMVAARLAGAPSAIGPALLLAAASAEALAAVALMIAPLRAAGALAAAALWGFYAVALFARRGQVLDCGCDFVRREKPVTSVTAARPALLALFALAVAVTPDQAFAVDAPFAALAMLGLYFAASELAALPSFARRMS